MDRTTEYIKMCEKAYKYLGKPKPLGLTNLWHEKIKSNLASPFLLSNEGDDRHFPVYRQDQLQEMVSSNPQYLITELAIKGEEQSEYFGVFTSMEQLWLAFVMAEKYQKCWDGENWKKK